MWNQGAELSAMMGLVYEHFDEFKLLLCCSQGTKYADFLHEFILIEQKETLLYMEAAQKKGVPVRKIDPKELHLLMTAYSKAMFEVVEHNFTREEAAHYKLTLQKFFTPAWRAILGL